eukprot:TRINITY_DN75248_c0_g1_i1.p1 TRINITY_DN75248_c0_g1~~TRINITY_DN75248_c0_g1_i1.p1  ORF type:complete len:471 (+),score=64.66 TRINITY_DN75248_c0_g1_i1:90-1502(+)
MAREYDSRRFVTGRCSVSVPCRRRLYLGSVFAAATSVEVFQHSACRMSFGGDIYEDPPPGCTTVVAVHDYTELLCKAGLTTMLLKTVMRWAWHDRFRCRPREEPALNWFLTNLLRATPVIAYLCWPGVVWALYGGGDDGPCGKDCWDAEALMEHGCCFAVLMALAAAAFDFVEALAASRKIARLCCLNFFNFTYDLEDNLSPSGSYGQCSDDGGQEEEAPLCWQVCLLWLTYFAIAGLYAAVTWGGWRGGESVELVFRCLDTICHAGICGLIAMYIDMVVRSVLRRYRSFKLRHERESFLLSRSSIHVSIAPPEQVIDMFVEDDTHEGRRHVSDVSWLKTPATSVVIKDSPSDCVGDCDITAIGADIVCAGVMSTSGTMLSVASTAANATDSNFLSGKPRGFSEITVACECEVPRRELDCMSPASVAETPVPAPHADTCESPAMSFGQPVVASDQHHVGETSIYPKTEIV